MPVPAALIQMLVTGGDLQGNLTRAEARIAEAARGGAQLALLPETLDLGWTHPSAHHLAAPIPGGEAATRLCAAAAKHHVHLCAGLTERDGDRIYNTAILIDPRAASFSSTARSTNSPSPTTTTPSATASRSPIPPSAASAL